MGSIVKNESQTHRKEVDSSGESKEEEEGLLI